MRFDTAHAVENTVWTMRLADFPRAKNRTLINQLANGAPPYTDQEQVQNRVVTNVNFLDLTNICHSARRQFSNAFLNVSPPFRVDVDFGPRHRRREWSDCITESIGRILQRSKKFFETRRSVFASTVLHGIGPSVWKDRYCLFPDPLGVEDALLPSGTLLVMENLPMFAVFRQFTAMQLWKMTHTGAVDPGWNLEMSLQAVKWADQRARTLIGASWPEFWSPEKMEERIKSDGAIYASDAVPTIDCYDVYFWSDEGHNEGWRRRIVLDAWGSPGPGIGGSGGEYTLAETERRSKIPEKTYLGTRGEFLYTSGDRVYAKSLAEIIHFQFADASCVAPFRYHTVRSLGFLQYAVCHLQNRLRCKFNDAVLEAMLQYFRVANPVDAERLTQVDLVDRGFIPDGLEFVKAEERWQVPQELAERAMQINRQTMADNSASFTQDFDFAEESKRNETATRTMAKINSSAAMVGAMLSQAYTYEDFRYHEMCRRLCLENSKDSNVRDFRREVLSAGVPVEALEAKRWNVTSTRIIGSGDKQLQIVIAESLMKLRPFLDPSGQKQVDRMYVSAYSEDYDLARELVPSTRGPANEQMLATLAFGSLMLGSPVIITDGHDHSLYVGTLLQSMEAKVQQIEQSGGMTDQQTIIGFQNVAAHIDQHLQKLAEDPSAKPLVKQYGDQLKNLMNMVKAYAQRLEEQMKQAGAMQPGQDPKAAAQAQAAVIMAQTKAELAAESHAQRTAQREIAFEQKQLQDARKFELEMQKLNSQHQQEMARIQAEHQAELEKLSQQHAHDIAARELEAASALRVNEEKAKSAKKVARKKSKSNDS